MARINDNFTKLPGSYLFSEIARRVSAYRAENPGKNIISLGIGDVTQPLAPTVIKALHEAVDEMSEKETFRGYGPERGYDFLLNAIAENEYKARGVDISIDEIFVSDGLKATAGT